MRIVSLVAISSLCLLSGCLGVSESDDLDEVATSEVRSTVCGHETRLGLAGESVTAPIVYRFGVLDADLAARPEVAAQLGYTRVTSCEQAREASLALLGDEPAAATALAPAHDDDDDAPKVMG